jgi:hypothetical protein
MHAHIYYCNNVLLVSINFLAEKNGEGEWDVLSKWLVRRAQSLIVSKLGASLVNPLAS